MEKLKQKYEDGSHMDRGGEGERFQRSWTIYEAAILCWSA